MMGLDDFFGLGTTTMGMFGKLLVGFIEAEAEYV